MKPKIAFFLPNLEGGGAERVFVSLANGLSNAGYPIEFVLANMSGPYLSDLDPKIRLINLGKSHVLFSVLALGSYLRLQRPAVIISALSNANAASIIAGKLLSKSCKVIITQHINWSQVLANQPTFSERIVYYVSLFLYPHANRIVAISEAMRDEIKKINGVDINKIVKIYNPVLTTNLLELSKQPAPHPWLNQKIDPVLLAVGRLTAQKGFETLIRSFHQVQAEISCKLIILGEGSERNKLETIIQNLGLTDKVDLPGFSSNPYAYMAASDLFILSSLYEGLPTVLIEAMACGIPVIATDCVSGPREILMGERYGDLVPVNDIDALAKSIVARLRSPVENNLIQKRAQDFSVDNAIKEYSQLIDSEAPSRSG